MARRSKTNNQAGGARAPGRELSGIRRLAKRKGARFSAGALCRAVVVKAYAPDDVAAPWSPASQNLPGKYSAWLFDLEVFEGEYAQTLERVPMLSTAFGITDMTQFVPREASVDVKTGNSFKLVQDDAGSAAEPIQSITQSDGDVVVVAFLDNDYGKPVIIGALAHPHTLRQISVNDSPKYKWQSFVRGNMIGIQDGGQIDIDVTAQTTGGVIAQGAESPAANPTVKVKADQFNVTVSKTDGVVIDDSDGQKITMSNGSIIIEEKNGGKITLSSSGGITIETGLTQQATIGGTVVGQIKEAFVKAGAWDDTWGPNGFYWTTLHPMMAALGSLAGPAGAAYAASSTAYQTLFTSGFSTSGATLKTTSVEGE